MPSKSHAGGSANATRVILTESLLATDGEKHATSKSLYGDNAARISSNIHSIHDRTRLRAYEAIFRSVRGKTVLHLGCGMGLYSMIAARHMAAHVVAIDTSSIVDAARVVAEQNSLKNITFFRGRLRDVLALLPMKQFDVILCEWMGALLLNESILADVLYARDNLLAPKGVVCPDSSSLHILGVSDYAFRLDCLDFWSNVYGFRMNPMKALVQQEVEACAIPGRSIVTAADLSHTTVIQDLPGLTAEEKAEYEAAAEQAEEYRNNKMENPVAARWVPTAVAQRGFETDFVLEVVTNTTLHFLTFYIDASFTSRVDPGANFVLGIRPGGNSPWTEVSIGLHEPLPVCAGEKVTGHLKTFTPADKGGKVTVVQVTAKTEGKVAAVETSGEYYYQSY